ncbi:hypothetical protein HK104_008942 [Borealophlyctis nickersoniae]|nr:hypothetical protein HK104_008942 [Borealophlyctis nickersoniae]
MKKPTPRRPRSAAAATAQSSHTINVRETPDLYRVARGEQGVFIFEPYKSNLLPLWRFKTPNVAIISASAISDRFQEYKASGDWIGCDMARKYLQMGYTRSMRYARHAGGRIYDGEGRRLEEKGTEKVVDSEKLESAKVFKEAWDAVEKDAEYTAWRQRWKEEHEKAGKKAQATEDKRLARK